MDMEVMGKLFKDLQPLGAEKVKEIYNLVVSQNIKIRDLQDFKDRITSAIEMHDNDIRFQKDTFQHIK